jgi:hypothetical protein
MIGTPTRRLPLQDRSNTPIQSKTPLLKKAGGHNSPLRARTESGAPKGKSSLSIFADKENGNNQNAKAHTPSKARKQAAAAPAVPMSDKPTEVCEDMTGLRHIDEVRVEEECALSLCTTIADDAFSPASRRTPAPYLRHYSTTCARQTAVDYPAQPAPALEASGRHNAPR